MGGVRRIRVRAGVASTGIECTDGSENRFAAWQRNVGNPSPFQGLSVGAQILLGGSLHLRQQSHSPN